MQKISERKPIEGVNLDISADYLKPTQARYLLNIERSVNNTGTVLHGGNEGNLTPCPSNRALEILGLVNSDFSVIRAFESKKTHETYVWAYSDTANHTIYRINKDLSGHVVYQGADLGFSDDPIHAVRGAHLFYIAGRKYLTWVDGLNWQGFLDVETSIATNSFHAAYFQLGEFEQNQYWQLPTRPPMHCMKGEWIDMDQNDEDELAKTNRMLDLTWQFRYKYIYTDGRESEWSPISTTYYVQRSINQADARGLPRCIQLTFSAGHPQVEKIVLAFRNCNGNGLAENNPFDWQQFKVISKYESCDDDGPFWERGIISDTDELFYDDATNDFSYIFCNEDECQPIDVAQTNRTMNPCPITSYAITAVENCLALYNNIIEYDPVECGDECFELTLTEPSVNICKVETVDVKVAVIIHNFHRMVNEPIFTFGPNAESEQKHFGGLMYRKTTTAFDSPVPYKQNFPGAQGGFVPYVEGTDHYTITKQYKLRRVGSAPDFQESGPVNDFDSTPKRRDISRDLDDGIYWIQFGTIKVIKGTKGYVRLGGHQSSPEDDYKNTSTTVAGIWRHPAGLAGYGSKQNIDTANTDAYQKEIYFDSCLGDVDLTATPFIVCDLSAPFGDLLNHPYAATAISGYIQDKDGNGVPRAHLHRLGSGSSLNNPTDYNTAYTDHNGFYFASWAMRNIDIAPNSLGIRVYVEAANCTKTIGAESTIVQGGGAMPNSLFERDIEITRVPDYEIKYFTTVRIRVRDCRGIPMPGVPLVIRGHKAALTNSSGVASVVVRSRMYTYGQVFSDRAVVMQADTGFTICDTACSSCMPDYTVNFAACFSPNPVIDIQAPGGGNAVVRVDPFFDISNGLKPDGIYEYARILHDASGRHTFVPERTVKVHYPSVREKQHFGFSITHWAITCPQNFPSWVRYMSIVRTANIAFLSFMQWVVDRVTYIDSGGKEVPAASADKIRLSIQSLVDNNLQFLSANTIYEWVKGDRLFIIADEKGDIYPQSAGSLDFLIEGALNVKIDEVDDALDRTSYELVIPNDSRISKLKQGTLIELRRPNTCETAEPYFELCDIIDVVDGEPVMTSGILDTFDTYQLRRRIKYNQERHIFPFPFEHHSPSDFWGDHCDDRGRVFFKNQWEKQRHLDKTAYISDALLETGNRNGLSTFRSSKVKHFKGDNRGGITMAYSLDRAVKIIFEFANIEVAIGDDFLRISRQGVAAIAPADEILVETSRGSSIFGLAYEDPLASVFGDNWCAWLDSHNNALIYDNYQAAEDVTPDRWSGYLAQKLQYRESYNDAHTGLGKIRCAMGFDPVSHCMMLTWNARGWADGFISNRNDVAFNKNETMIVDVTDRSLFFASFTPECFGVMRKSDHGSVFFCFRQGYPFVHKEKMTTGFNNFFGVQCDQHLVLIINDEPNKDKLFIAMQQNSLMKYFASRVLTLWTDSRTGQVFQMESEIPPAKVTLSGTKHNCSFLFNKLTPGVDMPLYKGEALRGAFCVVYLTRDNTYNDSVLQKDDTKRQRYNELKNILFTYAHNEQSAFNT